MNQSFKTLAMASVFALSASGAALAAEGPHWGYDPANPDGPQNWGNLKDSQGAIAYPDCNGVEQSPINIDETVDGDDVRIRFHLHNTPLNVINNGHVIQVDYETGSRTAIDGHRYK